ncbi:MAG: phosphatidylserine decarboxylase family protein [Chloroflexota bacterium]|nr:phosphatidylserine decarboxylase family protein [Chloroflexota bacterium]
MIDEKRSWWPFARGAGTTLSLVAIPTGIAVVLWVRWPHPLIAVLAAMLVVALLLVFYFFRDPERHPPVGDGLFVAPADGQVMTIRQIEEPIFLQGPATQISIFMSVLNVHVNRSPMAGEVAFQEHRAGRFLPAYRPEASTENESNLLGLVEGETRVLIKQIAGIMARRIVCWPSVGDQLARGQRFGLIKLGSCVELFLPPDAEVLVAVGDRVRAGEDIVARANQAPIKRT